MWGDRRVSVVLMTYAERDSIRSVIEGFYDTGVVDEVLVVNNNAEAGTVEEVEQTEARMVFETSQGYGHACRRGPGRGDGDLIVLAEPDGTFLPSDIHKLLVFVGECDAVFGTRTTRELIWHGANMDWFLRWGNWAVAKLDRGALQHQPPQRRRLHLPRVHARARRPDRRAHAGRRQPRRSGDDAADDHLRRPLRRDPGQLPAPGRHLVGHRQPPHGASASACA